MEEIVSITVKFNIKCDTNMTRDGSQISQVKYI